MAASYGHTEAVKALIAAGADVNAKTNDGKTALMKAASRQDIETVKILIAAGADVNVKTEDGQTALSRAKSANIAELLRKAGAH